MEEEKKDNKNGSDYPKDDRFFRNNDKEKDEKEDQKSRSIIQLPEIEIPTQKEKEKVPEPSPPPIENETIKETKENPSVKFAKDSVKTSLNNLGVGKIFRNTNIPAFELNAKMRRLLTVYALSVLLCLSFLFNIFFVQHISGLKSRMDFSMKTVEEAVVGKERFSEDLASLSDENTRLKKEIASLKSVSKSLEQQSDSLKTDLAKSEEDYARLEEAVQTYGIEVRDLAMRRIEYYDAYKTEKKRAESLTATIKDLQNAIIVFEDVMASLAGRHKEEIVGYVQDVAFLYVNAGMYDKAIDAFDKLVSLGAADADTYYNLAVIYEETKRDRDEAIRNYRKYLELNPNAEDFYEVKIRISSLERVGKNAKVETLSNFKIDLDKLKF